MEIKKLLDMKKTILLIFCFLAALSVSADNTKGFLHIFLNDGTQDSINVEQIGMLNQSKVDLQGRAHEDFVTMVINITTGEKKVYALSDIDKVILPDGQPWQFIRLVPLGYGTTNSISHRIVFNGTFPRSNPNDTIRWQWEDKDSIYLHMDDSTQDVYKVSLDSIDAKDSCWAWTDIIRVHKVVEPMVVYYPGQNAPAYNKVNIATLQTQEKVDKTFHIGVSGDCATDTAVFINPDTAKVRNFSATLKHHSAYFAFIAHNDRVPSVKLKSVHLEASKPIAGVFTFDGNGIDLSSVEDPQDTIRLQTPFFFDQGYKHTPRNYATGQDSTAAYMVVAPQRADRGQKLELKFRFNVVDTLSNIDTCFVKTFRVGQLNPNTVYTFNANIPDTLFAIVDLGLGDTKFAFRNVEAYFERGPQSYYGGAFSYGESNTKNEYSHNLTNYNGGLIDEEFKATYDAAYQRWGGCWREMLTEEADTLLSQCTTEWTTYNGTHGVLVTGPSGKRIFLPVNDACANYWAVNRDYVERDLHYHVGDWTGPEHDVFPPIYVLMADKNRSGGPLYASGTAFLDPGYCRGVLEYSTELPDGDNAHSMMLARHVGESDSGDGNFRVQGLLRDARPWPSPNSSVYVSETGFVFGTDSATLYWDENNPDSNMVWTDSLFIKRKAAGETPYVAGMHILLKDGSKRIDPYEAGQQYITFDLSSKHFLGYLDKTKTYFVREYFIYNGKRYYATKATALKGYFPHTAAIRYQGTDETATLNGYVVGVSSHVLGKAGFLVTDSVYKVEPTNEYEVEDLKYLVPERGNSVLYLSDQNPDNPGEVSDEMTFSTTLTDLDPKRYYIARAVFITEHTRFDGTKDTIYLYAPESEIRIFKPLEYVDLGVQTKWATLDVNAQFPEERDARTKWNTYYYKDADGKQKTMPVPDVVTDIGGTAYDYAFTHYRDSIGYLYAMPTRADFKSLVDSCTMKSVRRFGRPVIQVTGINGNVIYMPDNIDVWTLTSYWTSERPWTTKDNAYYENTFNWSQGEVHVKQTAVTDLLWLRPVWRHSGTLSDGSQMFVSTDTVGMNAARDKQLFYGRVLGITPTMRENKTITRGFVLHDFKWGTLTDGKMVADMPKDGSTTAKKDIINGLYTVELPENVIGLLDPNKEYWYRAYVKVNNEILYGVPKRLKLLTATVKDMDWEVHENSATLIGNLVGTVFVKEPHKAVGGFITGKNDSIDLTHYDNKIIYYDGKDKVITDGDFSATMSVPIDTIYWVRAFVTTADGKTHYSEPRQFGLDYIDLGLPSGSLWANISVGSSYPEDQIKYFSIAEARTKQYYNRDSYVKYSQMKRMIECKSNSDKSSYTFPYLGAIHHYEYCTNIDSTFWKHFSGTKNDAAYMNWCNMDTVYVENKDNKYIDNKKYGDLSVMPNTADWLELKNNCTWKLETVFDVQGWRITSKQNGNSIFLPFRGRTHSVQNDNQVMVTDTLENGTMSYHQVGDSLLVARFTAEKNLLNDDLNDGRNSYAHLVDGFCARPVERYNIVYDTIPPKLRDKTLLYLNTDTCIYLDHRTQVVLEGQYRVNYPLANYELGFFVNDSKTVDADNKKIDAKQKQRCASTYFAVLDKDDNLASDTWYYYRFYMHDLKDGKYYYANDLDSFRLAKITTKHVDWTVYETKAHLFGLIEGVMPAEASSNYKVGFIVGRERKLTYDNKVADLECTNQLLSNHNGPIDAEYTNFSDGNYYFCAYAYYNGTYHYGDVNLFGLEIVDMGLPSGKKWANINVDGANCLTGSDPNYLSDSYGVSDGKGRRTIGPGGENDAAHTKWHNVWRMAYDYEAWELINNCTWARDTIMGMPGIRLTSKINGNSLFFRANYMRYTRQEDIVYALNSDFWLTFKDDLGKPKPRVETTAGSPMCRYPIRFFRPIFDGSFNLENENKDSMLIRTDAAIIHDNVDNVTFFGSFIGLTQQRFGGKAYSDSTLFEHAGFIVGTDTLTTHKQYMKYDFIDKGVHSDTIYYNLTENINLFKIDSTYWVRAYVFINGQYYYGRAIKFVRQPTVATGDVKWAVGRTKATLYGKVTGFNNEYLKLGDAGDDDTMRDITELAKTARVGFILGYNDTIKATSPKEDLDSIYDLGQAANGSYTITVDYHKDTTYYYRAFIQYGGKYVYGKVGHYGLQFVDLGLPMQWASISVGERFAEDNSTLYTWGDTVTQETFKFEQYRFYYATGDDEYNNLGNEIKTTPHDVAHRKWNYTWDKKTFGGRGALWSMPSADNLQMLIDSCIWKDTISRAFNPDRNEYYTVKGYRIYNRKDTTKSIFIANEWAPEWTISGYHDYYGPFDKGPLWSSSRAPHDRNAISFEIGLSNRLMKYHYRYHGHYVRPMAYINVNLADGHKMSITTERTSWVAGAETATIYGCVLGIDDEHPATYGFVVGKTDKSLTIDAADVDKYDISKANGGLFYTTLKDLDNNRLYYYRAYVTVDGKTYYGEIQQFGVYMVDLGLPSGTKWANVNLGSWHKHDHGEYYAWGETEARNTFNQTTYKYMNGITGGLRDIGGDISGNDTTDVANNLLGLTWRMADKNDWNELISQCTWTRDTLSHIPGYRVTGKNGNYIFLPANYYKNGDRDANVDYQTTEEYNSHNHDNDMVVKGGYWSSIRDVDYRKALATTFSTDSMPNMEVMYRYEGNAIRPVASGMHLRTTGTDWVYGADSVTFYLSAIDLHDKTHVGILIGKTPDMTEQTALEKIQAIGQDGLSKEFYSVKKNNTYNDSTYYYRAYAEKEDGTLNIADARQFGLEPITIGSMQWANINIDAASPEEMGLNGVLPEEYRGKDPAQVAYGGLWRMPSEEEKQQLLAASNIDSTTLYGVKMYRLTDKNNSDNKIYLTSLDPSKWGYRAVKQVNLNLDDGKTLYLRTDSTTWHVGDRKSRLNATLIGDKAVLAAVQERGFVIGTKPTSTLEETGAITVASDSLFDAGYLGTITTLPEGTHYYRAYIKYGDKVYYGDEGLPIGFDYVDLGLPSGVKWASLNMGASIKWTKGGLYAWGDTITRQKYTQDSYLYYDKKLKVYKTIGSDISSNKDYDVAALLLDGARMPSETDLQELIDYCDIKEIDGGFLVTSKENGDSIFLPKGLYWTSTAADAASDAVCMEKGDKATHVRYSGLLVRAVKADISTLEATDITATGATLNGIMSMGNIGSMGFEYSLMPDMTDSTNVEVTKKMGAYSYALTGLNSGAQYYFRAFAKLPSGQKVYGAIKNFVTPSATADVPNIIDLGLSVRWADRNVGANLPETRGDHYAWGDTETRGSYTIVTYSHATGKTDSNAKYENIGTDISNTEYDVASKMLDGCWRMPTLAEINELLKKCTWTWGTKGSANGYWVTNGQQTIFLPAGGYREEGATVYSENTLGRYWSSNIEDPTDAFSSSLYFDMGSKKSGKKDRRYVGYLVRPVYQTNGKLGDRDVYAHTVSATASHTVYADTLRGSVLGYTQGASLTQGFVIGTIDQVTKANALINTDQPVVGNGPYLMVVDSTTLGKLTVGETYYVRAYISDGTNVVYADNAVKLADNTFRTDSIKWGLGEQGTMYAHTRGTKGEGLKVGFRYWQKADMSDSTSVDATFSNTNPIVFTGTIPCVHVGTYYYQAFTVVNGEKHYGNIRTFGAQVVDLGLPSGVKWVDMNLGADTCTVTGTTYKWGALQKGDAGTALSDSTAIGGLSHDVAHKLLEGNYRMPSVANINELLKECQWISDGHGFRVTGPNGNVIYIPMGNYWSSQQGSGDNTKAATLSLQEGISQAGSELRTALLLIRPTMNPGADKNISSGGNAGSGGNGGGAHGDD